ncbi:MAG: UDP-N-acetylglucosamine 2-epimerase (hydrolyzing) [Acidobacteria bacterium]|nr:UDP-N-acetylglucosamine 2-epimerase (hydrolyzing) [Acidobacteriota bacterium]
MKRRVCVVVTARPSYSRIKTALRAIAAHPDLELQLVVAASALLDRYGDVSKLIEADGFRVDARVFIVLEGETPTAMAKSTGLGLLELATVFDNLRPHVVVSVADRYETLATAVAAAYMNIPVAHVQGGEVTGSIDEKVRHAVTKLADVHLVSCEPAAARVVRMGEEPGTVHVTGCPSIDIAMEMLQNPQIDFEPVARYGGVGAPLDLAAPYVVVMQHPVTTEYDDARHQVLETLHAVNGSDMPALWFWPNVDAGSDGTSGGIRAFREEQRPAHIRFFKNMSPVDFLKVLYNCRCLIGNSSVGIRECSFLGVPVINIGSRQSGRDRGRNVIDVDYDRHAISDALATHLANGGRYPSDPLYGTGRAGERIADCLAATQLTSSKRLTY